MCVATGGAGKGDPIAGGSRSEETQGPGAHYTGGRKNKASSASRALLRDYHRRPPTMAPAISARIYNPPALPDYLKRVCDLKPIIGTPNDDEVKGIHAVLRMAHTVAHIPEIFGPELAMNLSQHLFEVQMARYRERYPSGMFPEDMVHTPPTLPPHFPVTLEPINGVPSDEELQGAQAAVRAYEQMAIVPSMFDPKVGMELSQHLFNIQFARYMQGTSGAELGDRMITPRPAHQPPQIRQPLDTASEISDEEPPGVSNEPSASKPLATEQSTLPAQAEPITDRTSLRAIVAESNGRLTQIADVLEIVKQVLIRTQQDCAGQGTTSYTYPTGGHTVMVFETMNDKGGLPTARGLPLLTRDNYGNWQIRPLSDEHLAQYLQFYNLGGDLVHLGDAPTIQSGKREDAVTVLSNYIYSRIRPS